jgi:hypothetical protein
VAGHEYNNHCLSVTAIQYLPSTERQPDSLAGNGFPPFYTINHLYFYTAQHADL